MALYFYTDQPVALLDDFKEKIDEGHVVTWEYDTVGDFTHATTQWNKKAWLRPAVENGRLALYILKRSDENMTKVVYGVYHGRFIESMLTHCDKLFERAVSSALLTGEDQFNPA